MLNSCHLQECGIYLNSVKLNLGVIFYCYSQLWGSKRPASHGRISYYLLWRRQTIVLSITGLQCSLIWAIFFFFFIFDKLFYPAFKVCWCVIVNWQIWFTSMSVSDVFTVKWKCVSGSKLGGITLNDSLR